MRTLPLDFPRACRLAFLAWSLTCAACAAPDAIDERFDSTFGVTWTVGSEIATFARTEAQFSRSARDYLYLGPVAVNRRGTIEYYLWVGAASTLDRGFLAPQATQPSRLFVYVDGEPIELDLALWSDRVPELNGAQAYAPPVDVRAQLAARVTRDQLQMISAAAVQTIEIEDASGAARSYVPWEPWTGWPEFLGTQQAAR
jgi:hypothetical protein